MFSYCTLEESNDWYSKQITWRLGKFIIDFSPFFFFKTFSNENNRVEFQHYVSTTVRFISDISGVTLDTNWMWTMTWIHEKGSSVGTDGMILRDFTFVTTEERGLRMENLGPEFPYSSRPLSASSHPGTSPQSFTSPCCSQMYPLRVGCGHLNSVGEVLGWSPLPSLTGWVLLEDISKLSDL